MLQPHHTTELRFSSLWLWVEITGSNSTELLWFKGGWFLLIFLQLRLCLDWAENPRLRLRSFFFFFSRVCETCGYYSYIVQWTVAAKFDIYHFFQPISAHRVLFTDPQISLFSNFFIKNRSQDTIHTFKNYFATVFFSF